jgi:prevent-host-death family protein
MATWQLQTAKAKLSELLRAVRDEGPQIITVRGKEEYVVTTLSEAGRSRPLPKTWDELYDPVQGAGDRLLLPERAVDSVRDLQLAEDFAEWDSES